ncbi:MAG: hypothetical protein J5935_03410 [Lachnospiraceae bacterium]|nr:hypothetical protein [Lachnospiraceae bacterium]
MIIKNKTGIVITIIMVAALSIGTVACGNVTADSANSPIDDASSMPADTSQESVNQSNAEKTQEKQIFNAVVKYCTEYYQLDALPEQTNYYWTVETLSDQECLVRFRSYTGAFVNYYVDVVSGEVHATNDVPALNITGEPSDERFNVRDFLD